MNSKFQLFDGMRVKISIELPHTLGADVIEFLFSAFRMQQANREIRQIRDDYDNPKEYRLFWI
jgi:hypothetical protein